MRKRAAPKVNLGSHGSRRTNMQRALLLMLKDKKGHIVVGLKNAMRAVKPYLILTPDLLEINVDSKHNEPYWCQDVRNAAKPQGTPDAISRGELVILDKGGFALRGYGGKLARKVELDDDLGAKAEKLMKKFKTTHPLPNAFEREVLTVLIEEAAEVQQRATKLLRFGRDEVQPKQKLSNRARLSQEVGQLMFMIAYAQEHKLLDYKHILKGTDEKGPKIEKYFQSKAPKKRKAVGRKVGGGKS